MITNRPAIDWLTLTTFNTKNARMMDALLGEMIGFDADVVACKNLQYEGVKGDGFFVGTGTQNGKDHFMFRFSGELSDKVMFNKLRPSLDCSRIDLQLTIPLPDFADTVAVFTDAERVISAIERERTIGKRKVNCITGSDGLCTLYVGSRSSEKIYRIYTKEVDGSLWLRFEVEYKGKNRMAGKALRKITKDPTEATRLIAGELGTIPDHELLRELKAHIASVRGDIMPYTKRVEDDQVTLKWLARQVMPAFKRVIGNEDTRDRATLLLSEIINFAKEVEGI